MDIDSGAVELEVPAAAVVHHGYEVSLVLVMNKL
jgi:hypothetical protein